ncbi:MAG: helix-turn-helix transcriptional regulator [Clostridia bacterium]|nr:helix-turn-helix transcriptional regulator [Clostridia bacterium]
MQNNLRKIRLSMNLSQKEVCCELQKYGCYIERSTYTKYESGSRNISCENLCALAKVFKTTTDNILGISNTKE